MKRTKNKKKQVSMCKTLGQMLTNRRQLQQQWVNAKISEYLFGGRSSGVGEAWAYTEDYNDPLTKHALQQELKPW